MKASSPLLDKVRYMKKAIQATEDVLNFEEGAKILQEGIESNIFIISPKGKILGFSFLDSFQCYVFKEAILEKGEFPAWYNNKFLLGSSDTRIIPVEDNKSCVFKKGSGQECNEPLTNIAVVPILGGGSRLGTLLMHRYGEDFSIDDIVLAEIGAGIISMEIMRAREEKRIEEARYKAIIEVAFGSLSYSELEAMAEIFKELNGEEGIVIASKVADKLGITRSVIVNALRKFESAGVIDSRSLGMKGTFIKVNNLIFKEEIFKRI